VTATCEEAEESEEKIAGAVGAHRENLRTALRNQVSLPKREWEGGRDSEISPHENRDGTMEP